MIVAMGSMLFAYISGMVLSGGSIDTGFIKTVSIVVYLSAFFTSGFSIMFSEA